MALLSIRDLSIGFHVGGGRGQVDVVPVVEQLEFDIEAGQVVGLVGESGCGKSVTAMSIMRLLPTPPARISSGEIHFDGRDLLGLREAQMRAVRGDHIGMVFQEPMTSLNPVYTVGAQLSEALRLHRRMRREAVHARSLELFDLVGIGAAPRRLGQYPHELSGGLRQRVMIAMALACEPKLLIADEPTTALDVTIQAQILDLLAHLRTELGMAVLLITHDLGVVAEFCDDVVVMYAGRVIEHASAEALFSAPRHPYTDGLLRSMPRLSGDQGRLAAIPGVVPAPGRRPRGCSFHDRCVRAEGRCTTELPARSVGAPSTAHGFACFNPMPVPDVHGEGT